MGAPFITVVTGLPRSGTSMLMQMLKAGGMPVLTDGVRAPDEDNPRGYLEYEPVKRLHSDTAWIADAVGKAVKVVHVLLRHLPAEHVYRIVLMRRALSEVLASQKAMLERLGTQGASLASEQLRAVFEAQLQEAERWLRQQPHVELMELDYAGVVADPQAASQRLEAFLAGGLDAEAMAGAVDPSLYRRR